MGLTIEQIDSALDSFTEWLSNPNIVGLYVGTKTVNDKETEDLAIIVDVIQKKTPEALTEDDIRIPSYIEIKVPTFKADSLTYRTEKIPTDVMKGFHHEQGNQRVFLNGFAILANLIPYQRRAINSGKCAIEVEGGKVPMRDWFVNLQILTSGGFQ